MLYDIKGFRDDGNGWRPVPADGATVESHYKQECQRLGIYDRGDLHRVEVSPGKDSVDVAAGESVSISLSYVRRRLETYEDDSTELVDEIDVDEARTFEIKIEDPDGMTSTVEFDPTDGAASFSLTPDKVGTWTLRSTLASDEYVDEIATVEGV